MYILRVKPLSANNMYLGKKVKSYEYKQYEKTVLSIYLMILLYQKVN